MTDILLDSSGDISIVNGDVVLIPTIQQLVRQQVQITLRTFRGEWPYNTDFGVPYVSNQYNTTQILGKYPKTLFDLHIREAIVSVENVLDILEYSSTLDLPSQIISVRFKATTPTGTISDFFSVNI